MPRDSVGREFVSELSRLVSECSALESIALKVIFVACALLL